VKFRMVLNVSRQVPERLPALKHNQFLGKINVYR